MDGRESSLSLQGEAYPRPGSSDRRAQKKYRVISRTSSVDETLFGSHRDRKNDSKRTSEVTLDRYKSTDRIERTSSPQIKTSLTSIPKAKSEFRVSKKGNPTYVDETLFGKKLSMPAFDPPWAEEKNARFRERPLVWSPPVPGSLSDTPRSRPSSAQGQRSSSRMNSSRPNSSTRSRPNSSMGSKSMGGQPIVKPPWR